MKPWSRNSHVEPAAHTGCASDTPYDSLNLVRHMMTLVAAVEPPEFIGSTPLYRLVGVPKSP